MNRLALLLCLFFSVLPAFSFPSQEEDVLRVGMELQYPPFETSNPDGNPSGISVDIVQALGEYLGREVEIINTAWPGLIPALQTGKIDIVLSSMTITEERDKSIDFSIPYARSNLVLLVAKDAPVQAFQDLNAPGRSVAVKIGTTGDTLAKQYIVDGDIHLFDEVATAVLEVVQGKADAFIYDELTIYENWKNNSNTTRMILSPIKGVDVQYWGVGIQEGRAELREQINDFIRQFRAEGGFSKIADRYLGEIKTIFSEQDIPFFFDLE